MIKQSVLQFPANQSNAEIELNTILYFWCYDSLSIHHNQSVSFSMQSERPHSLYRVDVMLLVAEKEEKLP